MIANGIYIGWNLFGSGSGAASDVNRYVARVLADGGTIEAINCVNNNLDYIS